MHDAEPVHPPIVRPPTAARRTAATKIHRRPQQKLLQASCSSPPDDWFHLVRLPGTFPELDLIFGMDEALLHQALATEREAAVEAV
jgi:hypothetical protein